MPNFRGIIIEGHSYTGKTSLLKELKKLQANDDIERSCLILSEHYTQILNIDAENKSFSLSLDEHIKLLTSHSEVLTNLYHWVNLQIKHNKSSSDFFYIIERFHLNHRVYFPSEKAINHLESSMLVLNPICILLIVSEAKMKERISLRYPHADTKFIEDEFTNFKKLQTDYILKSYLSNIPTLIINTDEMDWNNIALRILKK